MIRKSIIICLLIFIFTTLIACSKGLDHSINDNFTTLPTPIENTIDNNSFQPMLNTTDLFTQRDLTNTVDKSQAISLSLKNNEDYLIDKEVLKPFYCKEENYNGNGFIKYSTSQSIS